MFIWLAPFLEPLKLEEISLSDNSVALENAVLKKPRFGELLRAARVLAGRSQQKAAKELNCDRRTIQRYEAGAMEPHWLREEQVWAIIARWIVAAATQRGSRG